jgi:hypothetical protein
MPSINVTTITITLDVRTPTLKELKDFSEGECPICLGPTVTAITDADTSTAGGHPNDTIPSSSSFVPATEATLGSGTTQVIEDTDATRDTEPTKDTEAVAEDTEAIEDAKADPDAVKVSCSHIFHSACLEPWIGRWRDEMNTLNNDMISPRIWPKTLKCPYCRADFHLSVEEEVGGLDDKTLDEALAMIQDFGLWDVEIKSENDLIQYWHVADSGLDIMVKMVWELAKEEEV